MSNNQNKTQALVLLENSLTCSSTLSIKIEQSFMLDMLTAFNNLATVESVMGLAKSL
jgi:EAL domain-containing protein (putative c-di-GMP-specific phosphodiesterase class I)